MIFGKKKTRKIKNAPRTVEPELAAPEKKKEKRRKKNKKEKKKEAEVKLNLTQSIGSILDGSFLTREKVISLLPFAMFLVFLAMLYIANQYAALRRVKEIETISKELKDLHNEHISTKSELMYQSKISEVAKRLESEGIKESKNPPKKIYINENDEQE